LMAVHVWTPKAPGTEFLDAPVGHTFLSDINSLAVSGITKGCNPPLNTHFCPDDFVTRAQMATFLVRALGLQHVEPWFEDLSSESAHWLDIGALAAAGITRGCNPPANDRFCADDFVTRG